MPLFFLGTREWRNRQTRTVQVRVPVMEWGFNSPLAHDETADPSGSAVFVFPGCGLWPPRVFRAPESPAAVCAGGRRPARVMVLLVAPRVFRAPRGAGLLCGARPLCVPVGGGPPARSPHASCARSGRSRGPPWPCRHPPAPRPGLAPRSPARPRHRPWEPKPGPPLPVGVMGVSRVEFLGCSGACCDKRRQSKVFFVWLSAALL